MLAVDTLTQTKRFSQLDHAIRVIDRAFAVLELAVPPPALATVIGEVSLRYAEQSIEQAVVQKLARYASGTKAGLLLLRAGYLQETSALQRSLDEISDDVLFLCLGIGPNGKLTHLHRRYLKTFYDEVFVEGIAPIDTTKRRHQVERHLIRDAIASALPVSDGELLRKSGRVLTGLYSDFLHAASPALMEMCDLNSGRFQIGGVVDENLIASHTVDFWNIAFRGLQSVAMVAAVFQKHELADELMGFIQVFEDRTGGPFEELDPSGTTQPPKFRCE